MKSISLVVFAGLLLGSVAVFAQSAGPEEKILGKCQRKDLEQAPYQEWYQKFYGAYTPNPDILEQLKEEDS